MIVQSFDNQATRLQTAAHAASQKDEKKLLQAADMYLCEGEEIDQIAKAFVIGQRYGINNKAAAPVWVLNPNRPDGRPSELILFFVGEELEVLHRITSIK